MDEFKPKDELKPDSGDRRPGRLRNPDEFDKEPQINVDDVDLDLDEHRPSRLRRQWDEDDEETDDDGLAPEIRPVRGRKKWIPQKASVYRQHMMMGIGILVLLLLIISIGSALKAPSSSGKVAGQGTPVDLYGTDEMASANQVNGTLPPSDNLPSSSQQGPQDVSLPPISATPTQAQTQPQPEGQQRVEVSGDLNNALTQTQWQGQIDHVVSNVMLPTEPAAVAASKRELGKQGGAKERSGHGATHPERKKMVAEPVRHVELKPLVKAVKPSVVAVKHREPATVPSLAKAHSARAATPPQASKAKMASSSAPVGSKTMAGDASAMKSAPGSHFTVQLSSSSNSANLNAWAKRENLQHYMVYQTQRNGQPWYVLVSGVYTTRDDAKRAISALPADVQAKNPWVKPIHQVQSDLK